MRLINTNQKGFTLIEILITLPIVAIVVAAASVVIIQVIQSSYTSVHMNAVRQVETAGYWVSRDGVQAKIILDEDEHTRAIEVSSYVADYCSDIPELDADDIEEAILILEWDDIEVDGNRHKVMYYLEDMPSSIFADAKQLWRVEKVTKSAGTTTVEGWSLVAGNIDASKTSCQWASAEKHSLSFEVGVMRLSRGAESGWIWEERTYEIQPRLLT